MLILGSDAVVNLNLSFCDSKNLLSLLRKKDPCWEDVRAYLYWWFCFSFDNDWTTSGDLGIERVKMAVRLREGSCYFVMLSC